MAIAEFNFTNTQWQNLVKRLKKKLGVVSGGNRKAQEEFAGLISTVVYRDVISHFKEESGPKGKWPSWSAAYADHMRKIGMGGNKLLQFSGRLRQSFSPKKYRVETGGIVFYNPAKTKSGFPYAQAHDEGGSIKGRPPKRQFMWLSPGAMDTLSGLLLKWMQD